MGMRDAHRIWRRSGLAVHALYDRARDLGIDADVTLQQSLYLQGDQLDARGLRREAAARARAGFDVTYLTRAQVADQYGIRGRAALRSHGSLAANPRRLAAGFLRAAAARGAELLATAEIVEVSERRDRAIATLHTGTRIAARHLVFATGYELPHRLRLREHRIVSTWAIATRPQRRSPWSGPCLIWEASSPYLYLRTTADGRVLCGGADEPIADAEQRQSLLERKCRWLQRRLRGLLPVLDARIDYAWGGAFGVTADGLPRIGAIPGTRRCYAVLGFGGNGITFSMMAAQMLRNQLAGDGDAEWDLVAFGRR
jgi:glycine/D-amino acid oxidase-like deaminating enzyme